jgi:hypothetical protein
MAAPRSSWHFIFYVSCRAGFRLSLPADDRAGIIASETPSLQPKFGDTFKRRAISGS